MAAGMRFCHSVDPAHVTPLGDRWPAYPLRSIKRQPVAEQGGGRLGVPGALGAVELAGAMALRRLVVRLVRRLLREAAPEPGNDGGLLADGGVDGSLVDASFVDSAVPDDATEPDGNIELPDGEPLAPLPVCTGQSSECVLQGHYYVGVSLITCAGVYFVGDMTLLLERANATGQFDVVQSQTSQTPGLGETFEDSTAPPVQVVYRVCVQDFTGIGAPPPSRPTGRPTALARGSACASTEACNQTIYNGCGQYIECGACPGGVGCNPDNNSCCPIGYQPRLGGGCERAPAKPCGGWDPLDCSCYSTGP